MESWIQTYTGRKVDPMNLRVEDIDIRDIAHHLATINRFSGAAPEPYSVAQHSWHVSARCEEDDALWGLLHDASEAYLNDIARPLKRHETFAAYRALEAEVMATIVHAFDLVGSEPASVHEADERMLTTEYHSFMQPGLHDWGLAHASYGFTIECMRWQDAEKKFLERFAKLTKGQ